MVLGEAEAGEISEPTWTARPWRCAAQGASMEAHPYLILVGTKLVLYSLSPDQKSLLLNQLPESWLSVASREPEVDLAEPRAAEAESRTSSPCQESLPGRDVLHRMSAVELYQVGVSWGLPSWRGYVRR